MALCKKSKLPMQSKRRRSFSSCLQEVGVTYVLYSGARPAQTVLFQIAPIEFTGLPAVCESSARTVSGVELPVKVGADRVRVLRFSFLSISVWLTIV